LDSWGRNDYYIPSNMRNSIRKLSTDIWMRLLIVVAALVGFYFTYQKYSHFGGDTNDLTVYSYAFAQTLKGRFFPLYYVPGHLLGNHLNFIILATLPVYAIFQSFCTLLFLQSVIIAISAWPLYRLAKEVWQNELAALAIGGVFLLFPTIVSQHVNQIHDDQFALPFLMWAFYWFWREDYWKFMLMIMLTCLAKETVTITTVAFGVYALFLRRSWKWVVTPIVFSVGYFILAMVLLTKVFPGAGGSLYTGTDYLDAYGKSPGEVLTTFVTHPDFVLQRMFASDKMAYLGELLLPVLYLLPFLSLAVIVALPNLLLNLIGTNSAFVVIPWHYSLLLTGTLLAASVFSLKRLARWRASVLTPITVGMLVLAFFGIRYWYSAEEYQPGPEQAQLERALREVPKDASILTTTPTLARFSDRPKVNSAYSILVGKFKNPAQLAEYDYVLLDGHWHTGEAFAQVPLYNVVKNNPAYQPVFMENNVLLLRRIK